MGSSSKIGRVLFSLFAAHPLVPGPPRSRGSAVQRRVLTSGGRASDEPLAFRPGSDGCAHPNLFEVTACSGAHRNRSTSCPSVSAVLRRTATSLPAKAAMEAQADRASRHRLRGLSRARTSGIRRSGLPRVAYALAPLRDQPLASSSSSWLDRHVTTSQ
jgi:hypothetical protein